VTLRNALRSHGASALYAAAFVLLVVSAYILLRGNIESSLTFVWLSMGLAGLAGVAAVLSVFLPAGDAGKAAPDVDADPPTSRPSSPNVA
jgi:hypothetical protein